MSDSDNDDITDRRVRTFVLISNLPSKLGDDNAAAESHLRKTLRAQTTGMMRCMVDISSHAGYALALFESKEAAIDASEPGKVQMLALAATSSSSEASAGLTASRMQEEQQQQQKQGSGEEEVTTLVLRPIMNERAAAPERTFSETITVQGEVVLKSQLAPTAGLAAVLKSLVNASSGGAGAATSGSSGAAANFGAAASGAGSGKRGGPDAVARWCNATRRGQDCSFGTNCWYIHRKEFQVTVVPLTAANRIRQRQDDGSETASANNKNASGSVVPANSAAATSKSSSDKDTSIAPLLVHRALPSTWRNSKAETVPITNNSDIAALTKADANGGERVVSASLKEALEAAMTRIKQNNNGLTSSTSRFFVKYDIPHGSPSDVMATSASGGSSSTCNAPSAENHRYAEVIQRAPLALKRDVTMHARLAEAHSQLAVCNAEEALALLHKSAKARAAMSRAVASSSGSGEEEKMNSVSLRVEPFDETLWMPASQYQILLQVADRRFVGAAQRTSWIFVDVCRRGEATSALADAALTATSPLLSEQRELVENWRQTSQNSVKRVLEGLFVGGGGNSISSDVLDSAPVQSSLLCINVAVPCVFSASAAPEFLPPRVLSVHDGDEALAKSSLLPLATKSAHQLKLLWRVTAPPNEVIPAQFRES